MSSWRDEFSIRKRKAFSRFTLLTHFDYNAQCNSLLIFVENSIDVELFITRTKLSKCFICRTFLYVVVKRNNCVHCFLYLLNVFDKQKSLISNVSNLYSWRDRYMLVYKACIKWGNVYTCHAFDSVLLVFGYSIR